MTGAAPEGAALFFCLLAGILVARLTLVPCDQTTYRNLKNAAAQRA